MKRNCQVRFLEGLIVVTQLANSTATFFAVFLGDSLLDGGLGLIVSYAETQHRNDELHFLLCFWATHSLMVA